MPSPPFPHSLPHGAGHYAGGDRQASPPIFMGGDAVFCFDQLLPVPAQVTVMGPEISSVS